MMLQKLVSARVGVLLCLASLFCNVSAQSRVSQASTMALGNSTSLMGQALRTDSFTLTVVTNETFALITFNVTRTRPQSVGYVAFGTGTEMSESDMLIAWPSVARGSVSWTLSQRSVEGHAMPEAYARQSRDITVVPALTTNSSSSAYTLLTLLRPLEPSYTTTASAGANLARRANFPIIYAYSDTNPESEDVDAAIGMHSDYGSVQIDLNNPLRGTVITASNPAAGGSNATTTTDDQGADASGDDGGLDAVAAEEPWTKQDTIVVVHAVFGSLAWLLVSPSAVLLARLGRHIQGWVKIHQIMQTGVTGLFTIVCFATGVGSTIGYSGMHFQGTHRVLGLVMMIMLVIQAALGFFIHRLFDASRLKRPIRNILHVVFGLVLSGLGFYQIWTGFHIYGVHNRRTPDYIKAAYFICIIFFACAMLISCGRLIQQRLSIYPWQHAVFGLGRVIPGQQKSATEMYGRSISPPTLPYSQNSKEVQNSEYSLNETKYGAGWESFQAGDFGGDEKKLRRRSKNF